MPSSVVPSSISAPFRACSAAFLSLLVALAGQLLAAPVGELIALYGGNFVLRPLSPENIAALCGIGAGLGWLGAQLSVAIHLRRL